MVVRTDTAFQPADTLALPEHATEQFVHRSEGSSVVAWVPFAPSQSEILDPDGTLWIGDNGANRIYRIAETGDTLLILTREFARPPVSSEERARALDDLEWFTRQGGQVDGSRIPSEKPFFTRFFVSTDGHVWVGRPVPADSDATPYDVFDPDGRFVGTVEAPFALSNRAFLGADHVLTATQDSLGVPYVVRFDVVKGGAGGS